MEESKPEEGMLRYRIEVGHNHEVKPGNIVGAIANEAGIDSQHIGRINIQDDYSLIDLPDGMPKDVFNDLKQVWVSGQQLKISVLSKDGAGPYKKTNDKKHGDKKHGDKKPKRAKIKIRPKDKGKSKKSSMLMINKGNSLF